VRDFALEVYLSKWEFAARYNLAASDAQSMSVADLVAMADDEGRARWERVWLGYTETYGAPWLRALIASTYDTLAADDILCFAGAQEGLHVAMQALLDVGDHAVVVVPNYQSAETIPLDRGDVTGVSLDADRGWALDVDAVRAALRPNTKLVSINFPNNPTGKILERDRFDALVALCRGRGIWLFSDEVYRLIERDPARRLPQVADVYERGLSLNVMSKAYGMPGLRIGWIAARERGLLQRMERIKHYLSICNASPSEVLAGIALSARETIVARNRALATRNVAMLTAFFAEFPDRFEWYVPDGGVIGFPRYLGAEGVEAFAAALVEEAGVLVLPAGVYRSALMPTPADRFRIGYGRDQLAEGLAAFRAFLSK
jgi:aspartate/methionine/tyrosine aminotransferase